eukprot:jgi/Astpho2/7458/fgenesh1_pg.00114_%23_70_t
MSADGGMLGIAGYGSDAESDIVVESQAAPEPDAAAGPVADADQRDTGTHAAQGVVGQKRKAEDVPGNSKVQALDSAPEVPGTDAQAADSGAVKAGAAEAQAAFETDGGPDGSGAATPLLIAMSPLGTGAGSDATPLRQLPPELMQPPDTPCDPACVLQVQKFIETQQKTNKSLNRELRKSRGYRNPYFLRSTVESFKLQEGGTCFAPEIWDPTALPKEDFKEALTAEWEKFDAERKARRQQHGTQFKSGGTEVARSGPAGLQGSGAAVAMQKVAVMAAQNLTTAMHGKTKWDKPHR